MVKMKIILHLEIDESEINFSHQEDWNELTKDEKEFELTVAINEYINSIDDWSQVLEFEESLKMPNDRNHKYDITRLKNLLRNYRDSIITNRANIYQNIKIVDIIDEVDRAIKLITNNLK